MNYCFLVFKKKDLLKLLSEGLIYLIVKISLLLA